MKAAFSLKHVSRITNHIGIIGHCIFAKPNRKEGYCVDDNARVLLVCLKVDGKEKETAQQLIPTYLRFLVRACDKKGFHQDLNQDLIWKDDATVSKTDLVERWWLWARLFYRRHKIVKNLPLLPFLTNNP